MTDRSQRRIVLGMPGYGKQTASAGRGFWRACRDAGTVCNYYQAGSLLASNFNQLWCLALNMSHRGERVDYFAMLHDDVGPEDFWLDELIDELEAKQLDVLGVVVPIKDSRGMTSLALHKDGDDWMPKARLSMHDVYDLPETFTSDDLGADLLLNTGCWVAKWNQEWCRQVHFEINDRIVFNRAANRYQAQTEPEDWHFSRQLHEIGRGPSSGVKPLRIGATRKIKVLHQGETEFTNEYAWGRQYFDTEACQVSPVANAFPRDISGWLLPEEAKALEQWTNGKNVLEIGSYCGLSTVVIARHANHVSAVDYFDGRGTPSPRDTRAEFESNIARYGVADRVSAFHPDAMPDGPFDVVFIDGAHDYESVKADIEKAIDVLTIDGVLMFHDYGHPCHPGVAQAVDELCRDRGGVIFVCETLAVVKPAAVPMEV